MITESLIQANHWKTAINLIKNQLNMEAAKRAK